MEKTYDITIKASKKCVWDVLFGKDTYPLWAKGNRQDPEVIGEWVQGAEIDFMDAEGGTRGLLEVVDAPNRVLIRRIAVLDKKRVPQGEHPLIGTTEEYTLTENEGFTRVSVKTAVAPEYEQLFDEGYDKCFLLLKELCER